MSDTVKPIEPTEEGASIPTNVIEHAERDAELFHSKPDMHETVEELLATAGSNRKYYEVAVEWAKRMQISQRVHPKIPLAQIAEDTFRETFEAVGAKNFQVTRVFAEGFLERYWERGEEIAAVRNQRIAEREGHNREWVAAVNSPNYDPHKDEHSL